MNENPAPWARQQSLVVDGIQLWYYPPPGPRTWAFALPKASGLRHYRSRGAALRAIGALLSGAAVGGSVDPWLYVSGNRPRRTPPPDELTHNRASVSATRPQHASVIDMMSQTPPGWLRVLSEQTEATAHRHKSEVVSTEVEAWTVELSLPGFCRPTMDQPGWSIEYGKPLVDPHRDLPRNGSCAEVEVTERFRAAGWDAWWSDGFGAAPERWRPWIRRARHWDGVVGDLLRAVQARRDDGKVGGVPDVIGVRNSDIMMVECKGTDKFKATQIGWLDAARTVGVEGNTFAVCQFAVR